MKKFTRREVIVGLASGCIGMMIPTKFVVAGVREQNWLLSLDSTRSAIDGGGATILISSPVTLRAGYYSNMKFVPAEGYTGPGPIFVAKNGIVVHENISVSDFSGAGCKVLSKQDKGNSFIAIGNCSYNRNGDLKRTHLIDSADLRFSSSVKVVDSNLFKKGDYIWIGDGKFKVEHIYDNEVFLERGGLPNIIGAKVFSGAYDKCTPGQYVTIDADDRNGIRIGDGGYAWNIDTSKAVLQCSSNAWFGFFHYCKKYFGKQSIENIISDDNGYCNIGLGYMNDGVVRNCTSRNSGNNCIDIFESKSSVYVIDNIISGAGVDGIFVGGNGETATVSNNDVSNCRRIGILINARKNPISKLLVKGNKVKKSGMNSLTLTGVEGGEVTGNAFDGSTLRQAIYLEKRQGLNLTGELVIKNNIIMNSVSGDVSTNYSGYGSNSKAKVLIDSSQKLKVSGVEGY
ncbi:right-handed parallel beta-helix repeat-containing protein [Klebsiella sp. R445]